CFPIIYPAYDGEPASSSDPGIKVRCRDISSQGIAFLLPDNPDFQHLVISLGTNEQPIFMGAEVAHSRSVYMHGQVQVLIGCKFTGREPSSAYRNPRQSVKQDAAMAACVSGLSRKRH